jgi:hypothetical protein
MKKGILFLLLVFGLTADTRAANDGDSTKKCVKVWKENHYLDLSWGLGENATIGSFQWDKLFPIALKKRLKIGFGARMNVINYWNKDFFTAPPQRVEGAGFDTLRMEHQTTYFFNLQFLAEVALTRWWDVGMNIDLVGASWGPQTTALYYAHATGDNASAQTATPENLNLMLFGKNDFGNLNSQFYFRFWPSTNVALKAGMSLATLTNITDAPLNNGNSRFHAGSYMGFLSLCWTPGRNAWVSCKKKTVTITPSF